MKRILASLKAGGRLIDTAYKYESGHLHREFTRIDDRFVMYYKKLCKLHKSYSRG